MNSHKMKSYKCACTVGSRETINMSDGLKSLSSVAIISSRQVKGLQCFVKSLHVLVIIDYPTWLDGKMIF